MPFICKAVAAVFWILFSLTSSAVFGGEFAITMDDPNVWDTPLMIASQRDQHIRSTLAQRHLQVALFVCGHKVDSPEGVTLLSAWDKGGHILGNHSYSHLYLPDSAISVSRYQQDILDGESLISKFRGFQKIFRFPFLKEGGSVEKRDQIRHFLNTAGYRSGGVTIDASDWYIDARLIARLQQNPNADVTPFRDFYLRHILDRARYYDSLAQRVLERPVRHTLLVHHNLLNALFLGDLLDYLERNGWNAIDARTAFSDRVFLERPNVLPAGESIIWSLAKAAGRFDDELRYPGEDSRYESDEMDRLGL